MSKLKYIIFFIVLYVIFSGSILYYYSTPTKGKTIESYGYDNKALLIIDLQNDCIGDSVVLTYKYYNETEIIQNTNKYIEMSLSKGDKIIYVKQVFDGFIGTLWSKLFVHGKLMKGSKGSNIYSGIFHENSEQFTKPKGDAFSNKELNDFLVKNQINELVILGIDGEYCVLHTVIGAINRGYKVSVVKDAIGFKNREKIDKLYKQYLELGVKLITL